MTSSGVSLPSSPCVVLYIYTPLVSFSERALKSVKAAHCHPAVRGSPLPVHTFSRHLNTHGRARVEPWRPMASMLSRALSTFPRCGRRAPYPKYVPPWRGRAGCLSTLLGSAPITAPLPSLPQARSPPPMRQPPLPRRQPSPRWPPSPQRPPPRPPLPPLPPLPTLPRQLFDRTRAH